MWYKNLHHSKLPVIHSCLTKELAIVVGSLWYHIVGTIYIILVYLGPQIVMSM